MLVSASLCATPAAAQGDGAGKILKAMSDYLAGQKSISLTFDSDIEVLTENFQKIQFTSSGQVQLSRPNMIRAARNGGYTDVELTFDGKTVTVLGKHINAYAQTDARRFGGRPDPSAEGRVLDRDPGSGPASRRCFRRTDSRDASKARISARASSTVSNASTWLSAKPRRTGRSGSRSVRARSRANMSSRRRAPRARRSTRSGSRTSRRMRSAADAFAFKPPAGAKKVELSALDDVDEIPRGVPKGAKK